MHINFINIIESTFMLASFYLLYYAVLKRETFFKLNRVYLIVSLIFAVVIPFLSFDIFSLQGTSSTLSGSINGWKQGYNQLNEVVIYAYAGLFSPGAVLEYLRMIYFIGIFIASSFFILGLAKIFWLIFKSERVEVGAYKFVKSNKTIVPFSLFKWIIINPEKYSSDDMEQIIAHEKMHAFQLHSIDLILIEVLVILFWFNPFIYWYRKSIRENHEYLADQAVVEKGFDQLDYQKLLLNQAAGGRFIGLTSRFSYSLSKNRLKMLTMMKSKNILKTKLIVAIPLVIAFAFFFINSSDIVNATNLSSNEISIVEQSDTTKIEIKEVEGDVYFEVDVMPKFNRGTTDEFRDYIQKNLQYPKEAKKNGEEGRVFVSFVVDKNGEVKNASIARGVSASLDAEALRVVNSSPKWTPGNKDGKEVNVQFTFPITFRLK